MLTCLLRAAAQAARTSEATLFRSVQAGAESQVLQATGTCLPTNAKAALQQQRLMATNSTDVFNVHHDTNENNKETKFDFTKQNYEKVNAIIANYPPNYKASAVIPVLDIAQQQNGGWLSLASMNKIAEILGMAPIRVYEVGTFYSMFNRSKVGKYYIQVCGTTPCRLNGAENILSALEKHLGIHMGQTTPDGMFTLGEMECMGCCVNAPMIVVSDYSNGVEGYSYNYYEDLTPQDAVKIAETYKAGKKPEKLGSQYRKTCEPAGHTAPDGGWNKLDGMTTLTETPPGPYCRDLDATPAK